MQQENRTPEVEKQLAGLPFWPFLSEAEQALVRERRMRMHYPAGAQVREGGGDCLGLIIVLSGDLRAYLLSPDGREMTLYNLRAGDTCVLAAACALDAISFETHVVAEAESEVLVVPADVIAQLIRENIHAECYTYKLATERFSDVIAGVERLVFFSIEQRIASYLLDEAAGSADDTIHRTHEQIAAGISSAREVVSRTLKDMARQGLVELFRGGVRLLDKPALYRLIE